MATLAALLLFGLAGCGGLPQPYRGRPGAEANRLAVPLAVRVAVPPPTEALLPDAAAKRLADDLAKALQAEEVPATATETPWPLDWRVEVVADRRGPAVVPRYRLLNADREPQAATEGAPVPLQAWADPTPDLIRQVATEAAPKLAALLLQVEAARKAIDPATLRAGAPKIRFGGVRGAPGDGNISLAARMREQLSGLGLIVQDVADGALYGLDATVALTPPAGGVQRVEIIWIVSRRDGEDLGRVAQLNEVPAGRLNAPWGDIAHVAAQQAAGGVQTVIQNASAPPPTAVEGEAPRLAAAPAAPALTQPPEGARLPAPRENPPAPPPR